MTFTIPNIFVAGKKAVAYEVNENFDAIKEELNRQNDSIIQNATLIDETKDYIDKELQEDLIAISKGSGDKLSINSGYTDAQGNACLLTVPILGQQWITWGQPVATGHTTQVLLSNGGTGSMVVSASKELPTHQAWRALTMRLGTGGLDWKTGTAVNPQWWQVKFPYPIKIFGLKYLNATTDWSSSITGRFYTNDTKTAPIGNTFSTSVYNSAETNISNIPKTGIITDTIYFERTAGHEYTGIGQLIINAQWEITLSAATVLPFNIGGQYPSLAVTFSDGKQKTFDYLEPLDITTFQFKGASLSSRGNLNCTILVMSDGTYDVGLELYEQSAPPLNPVSGDVWIDTSTMPAKTKYFGGLDDEEPGVWVEVDGVALGGFVITNGLITSCTTLPYNSLKNALSAQNKEYISSLGMPSDKYIDLTLGASGNYYTAPASGYFFLMKASNAVNQYLSIYTSNSAGAYVAGMSIRNPQSGTNIAVCIPARAGQRVFVSYDVGGTTGYFRFTYTEGAKS